RGRSFGAPTPPTLTAGHKRLAGPLTTGGCDVAPGARTLTSDHVPPAPRPSQEQPSREEPILDRTLPVTEHGVNLKGTMQWSSAASPQHIRPHEDLLTEFPFLGTPHAEEHEPHGGVGARDPCGGGARNEGVRLAGARSVLRGAWLRSD